MTSLLRVVRTKLALSGVAPSHESLAPPREWQYQFAMRHATFDPFRHTMRVAVERESGRGFVRWRGAGEIVLFDGEWEATHAQAWSVASCWSTNRFTRFELKGRHSDFRELDMVLVVANEAPHVVHAMVCRYRCRDTERNDTLQLFADRPRETLRVLPEWRVALTQ